MSYGQLRCCALMFIASRNGIRAKCAQRYLRTDVVLGLAGAGHGTSAAFQCMAYPSPGTVRNGGLAGGMCEPPTANRPRP
jgi:hypothetical protein